MQDDGGNVVAVDRADGLAEVRLPAAYRLPQPLPPDVRPRGEDVVTVPGAPPTPRRAAAGCGARVGAPPATVNRRHYLLGLDPDSGRPRRVAPCRWERAAAPPAARGASPPPASDEGSSSPTPLAQRPPPPSPAGGRRAAAPKRPRAADGADAPWPAGVDPRSVYSLHVRRQRARGHLFEMDRAVLKGLYATLRRGLVALGVADDDDDALAAALRTASGGRAARARPAPRPRWTCRRRRRPSRPPRPTARRPPGRPPDPHRPGAVTHSHSICVPTTHTFCCPSAPRCLCGGGTGEPEGVGRRTPVAVRTVRRHPTDALR